jgi:hypothetical protein
MNLWLLPLGKTAIYEPQLGLSIFDTMTRFVLWTFTEPVQGGFRKLTWEETVHQGMESLLDEIKKLGHSTVRQSGRALIRTFATNFSALYRHCHCVATAKTQGRDATAGITADHFVD